MNLQDRSHCGWGNSRIGASSEDRGIGVLITDHNVRETSTSWTARTLSMTAGADGGAARRYRQQPGCAAGLSRRAVYALTHMRQGQRQELRLSHRLAMTPRLQQAIKLLQLSHLDLAESVAQEVEENPLLQREWDDPIHSQGTGEAYDWLQQVAQPEPDLRGHLLQQLGQQRLDTSEQALAVELIDALDQDGYLRVDLEDLSAEAGCSTRIWKAWSGCSAWSRQACSLAT